MISEVDTLPDRCKPLYDIQCGVYFCDGEWKPAPLRTSVPLCVTGSPPQGLVDAGVAIYKSLYGDEPRIMLPTNQGQYGVLIYRKRSGR